MVEKSPDEIQGRPHMKPHRLRGKIGYTVRARMEIEFCTVEHQGRDEIEKSRAL